MVRSPVPGCGLLVHFLDLVIRYIEPNLRRFRRRHGFLLKCGTKKSTITGNCRVLLVKSFPGWSMNERIQFISRNGKQVLLVDLSNCSAGEVVKIAREVPKVVTSQPRDSVLLLADLSGASFDREAVRAIKESAVFDKPYIKKSAWFGAENLPHVFYENLKSFTRREFPVFENREAALKWLTED